MIIKYNRFALLPRTCCKCEKSFWLEPYKHYKVTHNKLVGPIDTVSSICKICSDKINSKENKKYEFL